MMDRQGTYRVVYIPKLSNIIWEEGPVFKFTGKFASTIYKLSCGSHDPIYRNSMQKQSGEFNKAPRSS